MIRSKATLTAILGALTGAASVQSSLELTDDTFINGNAPATAFGDTPEPLYVHTWGPKALLVRFDGSELRGDIASAELRLRLTDLAESGTIEVYTVTESWDESTVTYQSRPAVQSTPVTSATVSPSQVGTDVPFDVTSAVQSWADGSPRPLGLMLTTNAPIRALFASKESGPQPMLEWTGSGDTGQPEVLDFSEVPVNIDSAGMYVLDRNWNTGDNAGLGGTLLNVNADDVVVDMRGFRLVGTHPGTLIEVSGADVEVRNGYLGGNENTYAIRSSARNTLVKGMDMLSHQPLTLSGDSASMRDSVLRTSALIVGSNAIVRGNDIDCESTCVLIEGSNTQVRDNRFRVLFGGGDGVVIEAGGNTVDDNVFDQRNSGPTNGVVVQSNGNHVLGNKFLLGRDSETLISVNGSGNTLDGNIAPPGLSGEIASYGIRFQADGNYYGDNRLAATVPFNLGGTVQTDWVGNIGY